MLHDYKTPASRERTRYPIARLILSAVLALAAPSLSGAADPEEDRWRISGFGTAGIVHTDTSEPWLLARDVTQTGASSATSALVDSRVGLQVNWQINAEWEAVAQAVLKDRTNGAPAHESIEFGFVAWHPAPAWSVRLGRVKPDVFLLADVRDVGYALPWVRPNIEFYGWIPSASLTGGNVAYQWQHRSADWSAKLWAGQLHSSVSALRSDSRVAWKGRDTYGLTLTRKSGPLTVKASFLQTDTDLGSSPELQLLEQTLLGLAQLPVPEVAPVAQQLYAGLIPQGRTRYAGLGIEYDDGPWLAMVELNHVSIHRGLAGGTRGYASLGHRWGPVMGYVIGGFVSSSRAAPRITTDWEAALTPYLGSTNAQAAALAGAYAEESASDARYSQHSFSAGVRWDFHDRMALKLQLDHVISDPYGAASWRHSTNSGGHANVISAALDWVF